MKFPPNLQGKLEGRRQNNSLRSLYPRDHLIDFSSNDYLGFSSNKSLYDEVAKALKNSDANNGSGGSRLLSGNFLFHENLEIQLAQFFKTEAALLFNSGYDANLGLLSAVPQRGDRIFYDEYAHASIRDGIRLSNAKSYSFRHNDVQDLKQKLETTQSEGEVYLVVETIYSMDGDAAPLKDLVHLAENKGIKLIVDEAHSTGIYGDKGEGITVSLGLFSSVFARIHTFGKGLGCHGAVVTGDEILIQYLINFSRPFIYTTAMPLHSVLTIKYAIEMIETTQERFKLRSNIDHFRQMIERFNLKEIFITSSSPIQSAVIKSPDRVKEIAARLREHHFDAKAILSPTVPIGQERIRFCIHSHNTSAEIQEILFLLSTFV